MSVAGSDSISSAASIQFGGERLQLLPGRAALLPSQQALIVADTHFGKASVFQQHGLAVPDGDNALDFQRLAALARATQAVQLIILGDLVHGRVTAALRSELVSGFDQLARSGVQARVVIGNHDRAFKDARTLGAATLHAELQIAGLHCVHEAADAPLQWTLSGHVHPVAVSTGRGRDRLRMPVFWQRGRSLVLPSFGAMTGGYAVPLRRGDEVWFAGDDAVIAVRGAVVATPVAPQ